MYTPYVQSSCQLPFTCQTSCDERGCKKGNVNIVVNLIFSHSQVFISNSPRIVVIFILLGKKTPTTGNTMVVSEEHFHARETKILTTFEQSNPIQTEGVGWGCF